ncbi:PRC and DUF2382 domain-containing protein [Saccharothrix deserti]|uniref:PRC and DUF2382 domain-containing protein n=1 Tax=Saccharothrix deserti TaxID=2593674 RepID=UPI00131C08BC|nr:PRC and DUF2382 domain-containing protein [Saccharothrix deserti]
MINQADVDRLYDCEVIDEHGERIGSVKQVWLDDRDGRPMWASVHTGLFGRKESFVPIQDGTLGERTITVPVDKQKVKGAPRIDVSDEHMSASQQDELYEYYGLIPANRSGDHDRLPSRERSDTMPMPATEQPISAQPISEQPTVEQPAIDIRRKAAAQQPTVEQPTAEQPTAEQPTAEQPGIDVRGRTAAEQRAEQRAEEHAEQRAGQRAEQRAEQRARQRGRHETRTGDSVTRHEEDLDVGTRIVKAGRVRLVKHVVTEQKDVSVPVSHEEVRVVREPAEGTPTGGAFGEEVAEVTLRREEPVVRKKVKPVEKVRLDKQTSTEHRKVQGQVRKEQVDVEREDPTGDRDS